MTIAVAANAGRVPASQSGSEIVTKILRFVLGDASDPELREAALAAANDGIDSYINVHGWKRLETSFDIEVQENVVEYDVPEGYKDPIALWVYTTETDEETQETRELRYRQFGFIDSVNWNWDVPRQTQLKAATPWFYTFDQARRVVIFDFAPSLDYVGKFTRHEHRHTRRIPHRADTEETLNLPSEFALLLQYHGRMEMAAVHMPSRFASAERMFFGLHERMLTDDNETQTGWDLSRRRA